MSKAPIKTRAPARKPSISASLGANPFPETPLHVDAEPLGSSFEDGRNMQRSLQGLADGPGPQMKKPGFLASLGQQLKDPEIRAALFRSGAETLASGNIGAGFKAGADLVDKRRSAAAAAAQQGIENNQRQQQIENSYNLGLGGISIDEAKLVEARRAARAREGNDDDRLRVDLYKHNNPSGDKIVGERGANHRTELGEQGATQRTSMQQQGANYREHLSQDGQNFRHGTASGDVRYRTEHPDEPTTTTTSEYPATPETSTGGFLGFGATKVPAQPKRTVVTKGPAASEVKPGEPVAISSDADYDALPSGATFKAPDGTIRTKP